MWCIMITAPDFKDVIGPFASAKDAAKFSTTRLIVKDGRSATIIKMSDPTELNSEGYKVR